MKFAAIFSLAVLCFTANAAFGQFIGSSVSGRPVTVQPTPLPVVVKPVMTKTYRISGTVWYYRGNTIRAAANARVELLDSTGKVCASGTTDGYGRYTLTLALAGTFHLRGTYNGSVSISPDAIYIGTSSDFNFGNTQIPFSMNIYSR